MPISEPKKWGKYKVLEVVGHGGMGVIYKAVDPEIGRLVGIKVMTNAVMRDPVLQKRFYMEAQSAGKLRHPNIVTIYDLGVQEAIPFIVMEFLEGESLEHVMQSGRPPLSLEQKLNIVTQVCGALAYAHERSIIHRDIKPGNVMLLKDGSIKLVDFGIARAGAESITRAGQVVGSIQYMSPEQIQGAPVDLRTDIFSTGVLLYQMLTTRLPFEGPDVRVTMRKIIQDSPPALNKFLQHYPAELDEVVRRVLAKSPENRYQTATELAFDLSQIESRLKRSRISQRLNAAEHAMIDKQWDSAREQLLQILRLDPENLRANALLREVQQRMQSPRGFRSQPELEEEIDDLITRDAPEKSGEEESDAATNREFSPEARATQVETLLHEARKHISTNHFTAALDTLREAGTIDPEAPGVNELTALASAGHQQERRRKELNQLGGNVQAIRKRTERDAGSEKAPILEKLPNDLVLPHLKLNKMDDQALGRAEHARRSIQASDSEVQDVIATVRQLVNVHRYNEAVRLLENQAVRFGGIPEFSQFADQVNREQRRARAFSQAKEEIREALAKADFGAARKVLNKSVEEFGNDLDTQLLQREIEAKESAAPEVAQALEDCRVLLLVSCYEAVGDILDRVSGALALVPNEMRQAYESTLASAITGANHQRSSKDRLEEIQRRLPAPERLRALQESVDSFRTPEKSALQETSIASLSDLENVLGEITVVARHYPNDQRIQSAVARLQEQLTAQIAGLSGQNVIKIAHKANE